MSNPKVSRAMFYKDNLHKLKLMLQRNKGTKINLQIQISWQQDIRAVSRGSTAQGVKFKRLTLQFWKLQI